MQNPTKNLVCHRQNSLYRNPEEAALARKIWLIRKKPWAETHGNPPSWWPAGEKEERCRHIRVNIIIIEGMWSLMSALSHQFAPPQRHVFGNVGGIRSTHREPTQAKRANGNHIHLAADTQLEGNFLEKLKAYQHNNVICTWPFAGVISV